MREDVAEMGAETGPSCRGAGAGLSALYGMDKAYLAHESRIHSRPVFEPYGVKYAYATPPEPGKVRGWVAGMSPPEKRPGVKRIIALGDSVTFGLGVHAHETWPAVLERSLDNVEVFNLAMCGWDVEQSVSLAVGELEAWTPDLVVWGNFPNDILPSFLMWGAHDEHPVFVGTSVPPGVGDILGDHGPLPRSALRDVSAVDGRSHGQSSKEWSDAQSPRRVVRDAARPTQYMVGTDRYSCSGDGHSCTHSGRSQSMC